MAEEEEEDSYAKGFTFLYRTEGKITVTLLSTGNVRDKTYTAEDVVEYVKAAKDLLYKEFGVGAAYLVCDSTGAHIKARKLLKNEFPSMLSLPCYAHQFNLWTTNVLHLPFLPPACKSALAIVTDFDRKTILLGKLRKFAKQMYPNRQHTSLERPTETRWYSFAKCFRSILDSKLVLKRVLEENDFVDKLSLPVRVDIESSSFWKGLENVLSILDPLVQAQAISESNSCTLCDVMLAVKNLYDKFEQLDPSGYLLEKLESRWKRFFDVRLMILAVALHPGHSLSSLQYDPVKINWHIVKQRTTDLHKEMFPKSKHSITGNSVVAFMNKADNATEFSANEMLQMRLLFPSSKKSYILQNLCLTKLYRKLITDPFGY
ncbi:uncharacterized protein LOC129600031 [Paramacrobiotus metropolitanus]|uniref:uncharacterized protein LOC129600031 n=1 Tax=Paramacrobiotus metropolitanus TaxID=2943436 RepID=UPI00244629D5|nr:uncharacterized protein LOC129600031 [Paramacrobiotus metropolitanus]